MLLSISLTLSGQVAVRVVGVMAILFTLSVRAAAHLIGRVRFVITCFAHLLIGLRSPVLIAFRGSARAAIEAAGAGVTRGLGLLRQLRVLLAISATVSSQAAVRVVEVARLSVRAAAHLIGRVRFMITRFAHLLIGLRSPVLITFRGSARAAIEAAGAGVTRGLDLLPSSSCWWRSSERVQQALARVAWLVDRSQVRWLCPPGIAAPRPRPPAPGARGLDLLARLRQTRTQLDYTPPPGRYRRIVAWRSSSGNTVLGSERLSQDVRLPADGKPPSPRPRHPTQSPHLSQPRWESRGRDPARGHAAEAARDADRDPAPLRRLIQLSPKAGDCFRASAVYGNGPECGGFGPYRRHRLALERRK